MPLTVQRYSSQKQPMSSHASVLVCIPSRYHARRLPGKALLNLGEETVIQRVYKQASLAAFKTIVLTDHPAIVRSIQSINGEVVYRRQKASNGSQRIFHYLSEIDNTIDPNTIVVNVQGDEPLLNPTNIQRLVECFSDKETCIASLYGSVVSTNQYAMAQRVKVNVNHGIATTFERIVQSSDKQWHKHIGIYAFRWKTLKELMKLAPSPREMALSLEQLRWMDHGYSIKMVEGFSNGIAIDTAADILEARNSLIS